MPLSEKPAVSRDEVLKIARLARLSVPEEELDGLTADMAEIIAFADTVNRAGDSAVESGEFEGLNRLKNVWREDEVRPSIDRVLLLREAGGGEDGFFLVPRRADGPEPAPAEEPPAPEPREMGALEGRAGSLQGGGAVTEGIISVLHRALSRRRLSCVELTEAYLKAARRENPRLNAYVTLTPDAALEAAGRVDARLAAGESLRPLEGIPMTLKDNLSTQEIGTTCCSRMLRDYRPVYDAAVWEMLRVQNAVLLGKSNMDEFAMGSSCETSCFGGARNPCDPGHVAGGSSGGAAAAVGGGIAAYGLGSDTGGSIRQPAAFCGLTGLKPTYGAVSRYGLIAYASSLDQIGPLTVTAADAAAVFDAVSRADERDSTCLGRQGPPASDSLERDLRGLRVGLVPAYFEGVPEEIRAAVDRAADTFRALGAETVEIALPGLETALPAYYILACAEASSNLGRYDGIRYGRRSGRYGSVDEMIRRTRSEGFGREVQRRILLGTYVLSAGYYDAYYKKAQNLRGGLIREFEAAFASCDLILAPTVPMTAFRRGFAGADPVAAYRTDLCTVPVNLAGLPAVSAPCGFDSRGLPIGMQLIGPAFSEARLLGAVHQFERETGGACLCARAFEGVGL